MLMRVAQRFEGYASDKTTLTHQIKDGLLIILKLQMKREISTAYGINVEHH